MVNIPGTLVAIIWLVVMFVFFYLHNTLGVAILVTVILSAIVGGIIWFYKWSMSFYDEDR